jgi:ferrous iron transport protein B
LQSFTLSFEFIEINTPNSAKTSILQSVAQIIAPIFAPLGFGEWGAVSALLAGIVAKELIVSSIGIINNISSIDLVGTSLGLSTSVISFSPASALSFLTFCLLYTPCIATISVMRAEIGAKWTIISVVMQLLIAYISAFFVYKTTLVILLYGWFVGIIILLAICLVCYATLKAIKHFSHPTHCSHCKNFACKNRQNHK